MQATRLHGRRLAAHAVVQSDSGGAPTPPVATLAPVVDTISAHEFHNPKKLCELKLNDISNP